MNPSTFCLEISGDETFLGSTNGATWNGWACPSFTFEVGQQIVEVMGRFQTAYYDSIADEFVFESDGEEERFGAVEVSGQKLYPIGVGSWIWEVVSERSLP